MLRPGFARKPLTRHDARKCTPAGPRGNCVGALSESAEMFNRHPILLFFKIFGERRCRTSLPSLPAPPAPHWEHLCTLIDRFIKKYVEKTCKMHQNPRPAGRQWCTRKHKGIQWKSPENQRLSCTKCLHLNIRAWGLESETFMMFGNYFNL